MMIYLIFGVSLLLTGTSLAQCSKGAQTHGHLQWSEQAKVVSPNHAWEVVVHPVLTAEENQSPVQLQSCQRNRSWPLLTLQRSAEIYWGPGSRSLLVVNEPVANTNKLLLFDTEAVSSGKGASEAGELDASVRHALSERLGENRHIEFYLPGLVSWKANDLIIAVGGGTSSGGDGPISSYCYGFHVESSTRRVRDVLSAASLKAKFNAECRVSP